MKNLRNMVLVLGALALSGCSVIDSYSEVDALNEVEPTGSAFTQALAHEYKTMSNYELNDQMDYPDALHFARKGLGAAAGDMVMPEPVTDWNLSQAHSEELQSQRSRLVRVYERGVRDIAPELSAQTQAAFDCWIEDQEEHWNDNALACKNLYLDLIAQLEALAPEPVQVVAPEPAPLFDVDPAEPMKVENAVYLVFFNWDGSTIDTGAASVLDAVAREVASNPPAAINVVGHADTSGDRDYNQRLSLKRANEVRDGLVARGIDARMINIDSRGESELLVATPDDVREPANRRASITFQ